MFCNMKKYFFNFLNSDVSHSREKIGKVTNITVSMLK